MGKTERNNLVGGSRKKRAAKEGIISKLKPVITDFRNERHRTRVKRKPRKYDDETWKMKKNTIDNIIPFTRKSRRVMDINLLMEKMKGRNQSQTQADDNDDDAISSEERSGNSLVTVQPLDQEMTPYCVSFALTRCMVRLISLICPELFTSSKVYKSECAYYEASLTTASDLLSIFYDDDVVRCKGGQLRYSLLHAYLLHAMIVNYRAIDTRIKKPSIYSLQMLWDHIRVDRTYKRRLAKYVPINLMTTKAIEKFETVIACLDIFNYKMDIFEWTHKKKRETAIVPILLLQTSENTRNMVDTVQGLWDLLQYSDLKLYMTISLHGDIVKHLDEMTNPFQVANKSPTPAQSSNDDVGHLMTLVDFKGDNMELKNSWAEVPKVFVDPANMSVFGNDALKEVQFFYVNEKFLAMQSRLYLKTRHALKTTTLKSPMPKTIASCYRNENFETKLHSSRLANAPNASRRLKSYFHNALEDKMLDFGYYSMDANTHHCDIKGMENDFHVQSFFHNAFTAFSSEPVLGDDLRRRNEDDYFGEDVDDVQNADDVKEEMSALSAE